MNPESRIQNLEKSCLLSEQGFEILADILAPRQCDDLARELSDLYEREQKSTRNKIGGVRNLLGQSSQVSELASSERFSAILRSRLGTPTFPVRALFFDKTPDANWRVPWHQDLTIAVREKKEVAEFKAWSIKDDILHVQPPCEILESMATIRIHLDDCDANNGALKIIPRSHLHGKLTPLEISDWTKQNPVVCKIPRGSALLIRPLLLHSSSPAKTPSHRRVLHIEYATGNLPGGLKWFDSQ
ncbi:MAG: phytanoyl-CoA dioxygenase family protein [Verrucomicrobiota bacterium]